MTEQKTVRTQHGFLMMSGDRIRHHPAGANAIAPPEKLVVIDFEGPGPIQINFDVLPNDAFRACLRSLESQGFSMIARDFWGGEMEENPK